MSADEDFFGLEVLESTKVLPKSTTSKKKKTVNEDVDIFESNFFPGLSQRENVINKHENVSNIPSESTHKGTQKDFFEQYFIRSQDQRADAEENIIVEKDETLLTGIKKLLEQITPVWNFTTEELVDLLAKRVIHETDDFIAFDKPYQMAYSGGPTDQAQFDRILQMVKKRVTPNVDRLYLINSLDKSCSGVILFAKNEKKQLEYKELLDNGKFHFRFRCLCKNNPKDEKARISIPLIKVLKEGNVKFCPLIGRADKKEQLYHLNTDYVVVNTNNQAHVSLLDAYSRQGIAHIVRSHLYYGLDCPILGDKKYIRTKLSHKNSLPTSISEAAQQALEIRKNDIRKLPMFMHLPTVNVPKGRSGTYSVVRAEMPEFFIYALKKLSLLAK